MLLKFHCASNSRA